MRQQVGYYGDAIRWYFNHSYHRYVDLPAAYNFTGGKLIVVYYYQHGKLHRTTGPAIIYYNLKLKRYYYQHRGYGSLEQMLMIEACK